MLAQIEMDPDGELGEVTGLGTHNLLERVGLALNSTLELSDVLQQLAEMTLEATGAGRCSIFLLDDDQLLRPAAAIGEAQDEDLWEAFQAMGPIDLDPIPFAWELMRAGNAVAVEEAAGSTLVPTDWVSRFQVESLVLIPLMAAGIPCGVMAVDHQTRRSYSPSELRLLEAIGSYAGVAVRNAQLFESTRRRSELNEGLVKIAAALASPGTKQGLLLELMDSYARLFDARLCVIGTVDPAHTEVRINAWSGTRALKPWMAVEEIPETVRSAFACAWRDDEAFEVHDDPWLSDLVGGKAVGASRYLMIPLRSAVRRGGILLGFSRRVRLAPEERAAAEALAAIGTAALDRSAMVEQLGRQLRRLEILHALGETLAAQADAETLKSKLNELLADEAIEVVGLAFRERRLAMRLGGDHPVAPERAAWKAKRSFVRLDDDIVSVPMHLDSKVAGALRLRAQMEDDEEIAFLEALAHGVAEVASRSAFRSIVEEAQREQAVAAERGRIAGDLHDTAGQLFVAIGLLARRESQLVPSDSPWHAKLARLAELADAGKWEISRAIEALAFFPEARRGITASLRVLARSFGSDSGIETVFEVEGSPRRLSPKLEQGLYRIAHEALSNAWRHSRCETVRLSLAFERHEIVLRVVDDGIGLRRSVATAGIGISGMRRAVDEVGGSLSITAVKPHGTLVEARVKREAR